MSAPFISSVNDLDKLADRLFKAGVFGSDVRSVDVAFAILLAGWELGFSPTVAARGIQFSRGKLSLSADLTVAACVRRRDVCEYFRLVESTAAAATYTTKRAGSEPVTLTWTIEQAKRAGLIDKNSVWKAHTEAMLRARCAMALARSTYPDLVAGVYDPDEVGEIAQREAEERRGPAAPTPAVEPEQPMACTAFVVDLRACSTLPDLVTCWHAHCRALHDAGVEEAASNHVGDWLGDNGYCVTATEQQAILSRAWPEAALRLADELARANGTVSVVEWYVGARHRVDALGEAAAAPLKHLIARTWAVRADQDARRPGKAFAEAVKAFERDNPERTAALTPKPNLPELRSLGIEAPPARRPSEPPAAAQAPADASPAGATDGPITTSKGEVLDSPARVAEHVNTIDNIKHLESAARKHGRHTWARDPIARRYASMKGIDLDSADAWVEKLAAEGPKKAGA